MRDDSVKRKRQRQRVRDMFLNADMTEIPGYHSVNLANHHNRPTARLMIHEAAQWCFDNICKPDDWTNPRRWFHMECKFWFADPGDHFLFICRFT
jgi:hypothetical protein